MLALAVPYGTAFYATFYRQPFLFEFFILSSTPTFDFEPFFLNSYAHTFLYAHFIV